MYYIKNKSVLTSTIVSILLYIFCSFVINASNICRLENSYKSDTYIKKDTSVNITKVSNFDNRIIINSNRELPSTNEISLRVYNRRIVFNQNIDNLIIIDITGRTILKGINIREVYMPCSPSGIYLIKAIKGNNSSTFKVRL